MILIQRFLRIPPVLRLLRINYSLINSHRLVSITMRICYCSELFCCCLRGSQTVKNNMLWENSAGKAKYLFK